MSNTTGLTTWMLVGLIIVVWPLFFFLLWTSVILLMSWLGGWRRLSEHYRSTGHHDPGKAVGGVSGMVGLARYNRVLIVTPDSRGMHINVRRIFRIGHPPLFIPWAEIRNAKKRSFFYSYYIAFDVGEPKMASMRLPTRIFDGAPVFID